MVISQVGYLHFGVQTCVIEVYVRHLQYRRAQLLAGEVDGHKGGCTLVGIQAVARSGLIDKEGVQRVLHLRAYLPQLLVGVFIDRLVLPVEYQIQHGLGI